MPIFTVTDPAGNTYKLNGPVGATQEEAIAQAQQMIADGLLKPETKPEGGFVPAVKAGVSSLKSDVAATLGRAGLMDTAAAEKYRAEQEAYRQRTFKPTEEGWADAPFTKIKELAGGSLPYMAAPLVAGGAAAAFGAPALVGMGAAGLTSAAQFTGSNLSRQVEEGTPLAGTDIQSAALASVPQAALDIVGFKMIPGIRRLFGAAGTELTPQAAAAIAKQGVAKVAADYARATGTAMTVEGLTEAGQQVFERLQAGLSIDDPAARAEYLESFIGGAVLGGAIAPAGRYIERGREQAQAEQLQQTEAARVAAQQAAAEQQKAASPDYAQQLKTQYADANVEMQRLNDVYSQLKAGKDPLSVADAEDAKKARDEYSSRVMQPLVTEIQRVRTLQPTFDFSLAPAGAAAPTAPGVAPAAAPSAAAPAAAPGVAPAAAAPAAVAPAAVAPAAVAPAPTARKARVQPVEEEVFVSEPEAFAVEPTEVVAPAAAAAPAAKAPRAKKPKAVPEAAAPEAATPEDTTVEPTEPRTLEESVAAMQPQSTEDAEAAKGQMLIPDVEPLMRVGAMQTRERSQQIRREMEQLGKELKVARAEGRKTDALAIVDRLRYLQEQGKASEVGPTIKGRLAMPTSATMETQQASRTSEQFLRGELSRARALRNLSKADAELVQKLQKHLPTLLRSKDRGTAARIADYLDSLQGRGYTAEREARTLREQITQIEAKAQREVSPRELRNMLERGKRTELSAKERGLMRLVEENAKVIMADPAARVTVARWVETDVGQGVGDATQELRQYFKVTPEEGKKAEVAPTAVAKGTAERIKRMAAQLATLNSRLAEAERMRDVFVADKNEAKDPKKLTGYETRIDVVEKQRDALQQRIEEAEESYSRIPAEVREAKTEKPPAPVAQEDLFPTEIEKAVQRAEKQKELEKTFNPPPSKAKERAVEREAEKKRNKLTGDLAALPGTRVSFERRRKMLEDIDRTPDKFRAMQDKAQDANLSQEERDAAAKASLNYIAAMRETARKKDETYGTAYRLRKEEAEELQKVINKLKKENLTEAAREKLLARKAKARIQLTKRDNQLARLRGVEISPLLSDAARQEQAERMWRESYGAAIDDEYAEYYAKQPKKRAIGPVTRPEVAAPAQFYTGDPERTARTKTLPLAGLTEKRGTKQRNVPISEKEMEAANVAAPAATMGPRVSPVMQALRQERELHDIASKKVDDLRAKLAAVKDRLAAYDRLDPKNRKKEVYDKLVAEVESLENELRAAQKEADRLAPQTSAATATAPARMFGETGRTKLTAEQKQEAKRASVVRNDAFALRDTTTLSVVADEAAEDGRILDLIEDIAQTSLVPLHRELAQQLKPLVWKTKLQVVDEIIVRGERVAAEYDASTNTVRLARGAYGEEDVLHELVHAATDRALATADTGFEMSRRQFLRGASAALGAVVLPKNAVNLSRDQTVDLLAESVGKLQIWAEKHPDGVDTLYTALQKANPNLLQALANEMGGETNIEFLENIVDTQGDRAFMDLRIAQADTRAQLEKNSDTSKPKDVLNAEQKKALQELKNLYATVSKDKNFDTEYGVTDINEFAAEIMSNTALRAKLDNMGNFLQRWGRAVLRFLGVRRQTVSEAAAANVTRLFMPSRAVGAPTQTRASLAGKLLRPTAVKYAPGLEAAGALSDKIVAKEKSGMDRARAAAGGFLGLETQFVDRFAPLERIAKTMDSLKGMQMLYYLRMSDQTMNFTAQSVEKGALQRVAKKRADGRTEYVIESVPGANLKQVVNILKKAPAGSPDAANRLFTMYLAAIRAKNKGFNTLHAGDAYTEADLDKAMVGIRATPGLEENFKQAREVYNTYNRNLIDFLAQSGRISKEQAANLSRENDYIPFYRPHEGAMELLIGGEAPIRIGSIADQPHLEQLVGGESKILDFLTSSVQNTSMITDMGLSNLAARNAMNELQDLGLAKIIKGRAEGTDIVKFKVDGEDYYARVDTEKRTGIPADLLVKGMRGIPTQMNVGIRVLGLPARLLRRAVMLSPVYSARQLFRDSLAAPLLSGANFVPVIGALAEIKKSTTKDALERRGVTGGQVFTGTSEDLSKVLKDMMGGKGNLAQLISKAEVLAMEADAATRRAQYNSYIQQGLSEMEATLMSLESMNFNKRGASPTVHMLNTLIPFFNSQIQGLNVLYKAMTGKMPFNEKLKIQEKLLTRGAMIAVGTLAYAAMMQDDEAYKNATPEQKYGNWFVRIPGVDEPVRVPIPFEIGYIFKALPEALYNSMVNEQGSEEAVKAFRTILLQTVPGGSSYLIPQAMKPAIEAGLGKSFYTGRDLVSAREAQLLPEEQFRENTSEIAKLVGSGLGLSPIKIEHLVSGYTGSMGLAFLQAVSMGVPTGESPEKTAKRLSNMPVVGTAFQPNDAGGIINAVYEKMNDAKKVRDTVEQMMTQGREAEARELVSQRADDFAQVGMADYFTSHMQKITQYENAVRASNMTGEEKREKLDELRRIKIQLAETVRDASAAAKASRP